MFVYVHEEKQEKQRKENLCNDGLIIFYVALYVVSRDHTVLCNIMRGTYIYIYIYIYIYR